MFDFSASGRPVTTPDEKSIRQRLGIPRDAQQVIIFGESSHWDPNWLYTSEQYYDRRIQKILCEVIAALEKEPRRVFSVESLFFLKLFWQRQAAQRPQLLQLINQGRLRLTGSGITTPDTLLPDTEAILRDFLYGQEWLRRRGMTAEPRLAYLPDDFGHSPALPSLLQSLGFSQAGISRIDGMYFIGADYRPRRSFPLAGSSAQLLLQELKTLDFFWRAADGAQVLCHWNAFTYFQGDMLGHRGIIRWMGLPLCISWRTAGHVARQIEGFAHQLRPLSKTPYLYCPIGCDFNAPIHDLVHLLDRYNETHYEKSGIWAVNAGMDDYLDLIAHHQQHLPCLELDPNPYWMGFYASRPRAKRRCNRITRKLVLAEKLFTLAATARLAPGGEPRLLADRCRRDLRAAWELVAVSNHHDFITGTSPDRVWQAEQWPLLQQALGLVDSLLLESQRCWTLPVEPQKRVAASELRWQLAAGRLTIDNGYYRAVLAEDAGGCLISLKLAVNDQELLSGPANDLVGYVDSGGLWRMGHEYLGGRFVEKFLASRSRAKIEAVEAQGCLEVRITSELKGCRFLRRLWFASNCPEIRMQISGAAARRLTITCRFPTTICSQKLTMDVPGGLVQRPPQKIYHPTFWPARSFVTVNDDNQRGRLFALLGGPACVSYNGQGTLEWVVMRNAPREKAFGFLPVLAHPASGTDGEEHFFDAVLRLTPDGAWSPGANLRQAQWEFQEPWPAPSAKGWHDLVDEQITTDHAEVIVGALKAADRGPGVIVRLISLACRPLTVRLRCVGRSISSAVICDARERDRFPLIAQGQGVPVPVPHGITSVRLILSGKQ